MKAKTTKTSQPQTEQLISERDGLRRYRPIECENGKGAIVTLQKCEDYDPKSGRWEPFYATIAARKA